MKPLYAFISVALLLSCTSGPKNNLTTNAEALVIDTVVSITPPETYVPDSWSINSFVNDFGEKGDDLYVETETNGTFSNSATNNEYLNVKLLVTTKNAGLFLHEYKDSRPAEKFIGTGKIRLKNAQEKELTIYTYSEWNQQGGLKIESDSYKKLRDFLLNSSGKIKTVVYDDYSSVYNFTIDATSFDKHFAELKNSKSKK